MRTVISVTWQSVRTVPSSLGREHGVVGVPTEPVLGYALRTLEPQVQALSDQVPKLRAKSFLQASQGCCLVGSRLGSGSLVLSWGKALDVLVLVPLPQ